MKGKIAAAALLALLAVPMTVLAAPKQPHPERSKKFDKEHPRRAEVLKRDDRESHRANEATKDGKLTGKQDAKIQHQEQNIRRQEQADAAKNGGHITKGEQRQLNREENGVNREINRDERKDARTAAGHPEKNAAFDKAHPRRAEVLGRTDNQNRQVNNAEASGKLTDKQGNQIKREDRAIRAQEQRDAAKNGGTITKGEQAQLNREENHVENQIKNDEAKDAAKTNP
jgi:hypothetical protein